MCRGLAEAFDGVADLLVDAPADPQPQGAPQTSAPAVSPAFRDMLAGVLSQVAQASARATTASSAEPGDDGILVDAGPEAPAPAAPVEVEDDGAAIDHAEQRVGECPEFHRQRVERGRRAKLTADPVNAMSVISYYLLHLAEAPLRAEEWTRCVEAVPGTADVRLQQALYAGVSESQIYASYYDEAQQALEAGRAKAARLAGTPGINAGDLLDLDRIGRILFCLGDRPDVDAMVDPPPATGEVTIAAPPEVDAEVLDAGDAGDADEDGLMEEAIPLVTLEDLVDAGELEAAADPT